jgi:hypothetical protein
VKLLRELQDRSKGSDRDHEHGPQPHGEPQSERIERQREVLFRDEFGHEEVPGGLGMRLAG